MEIVDGVALVSTEAADTCGTLDTGVIRVRLAEGKAEPCGCGSGLRHWEAFSRQRAGYCMVSGCNGKPEIGARVEKIGNPGKVCLVPLCSSCAARQGEVLAIVKGVALVPADAADTCRPARTRSFVRVAKGRQSWLQGCQCESWLKHWETFSGQRAGYCTAVGCEGKPEIGAVVHKEGEPGTTFVVPLCQACIAKDEALEIISGVRLVPANGHDTCGQEHALEETHWTTSVA